ncbi:hypothetical protein TrVE_jg10520 [Triparma verrucosa]|uniref:Glycosyltransferase family 32 protein n=1 Tax=Triparma verrucosa TaxID=1606542 RepID=A0A9W7FM73_9STRA|nr:hypothetical protein TrVE_jg10520 [Triparma verrucosa]
MISRKSLVTVAVVFILSIIVKTQILPLTIFVDSWPGLGEPDPDFNISLTVATLTDTRILGPDSDPPGRHIVDTSKNYKYIWQTAKHQSDVPPKVAERIKKFAPNYEYVFHDDAAAEEFLAKHFDERVLAKYKGFKVGAHKADLWRYCVLFKMGGVYMDIETVLLRSMDEILADASPHVTYTVNSAVPDTVMQGFIAAPPNSAFFEKCIQDVMDTPEEEIDKDYLLHTRKFFKRLMNLVRTYPQVGQLWVPKKVTGEGQPRQKWVLFEESCNREEYEACGYQSDVYNNCCIIQDTFHRPMMFTRYPDFPWGGKSSNKKQRVRKDHLSHRAKSFANILRGEASGSAFWMQAGQWLLSLGLAWGAVDLCSGLKGSMVVRKER